jgi:hypothetical protein
MTANDDSQSEERTSAAPPAAGNQEPEHAGQQSSLVASVKQSSFWLTREGIGLIFDGIMMLVGVIGIAFLVQQSRQTEAALKQGGAALAEAKEANRLTKLAQQKADDDAKATDVRAERLVVASEGSANAAKVAAAAARSSADSARAASSFENARYVDEQRANVTLVAAGITPFAAGQKYTIEVRFRNIGKSPARAFRQLGRSIVVVTGIPFFPDTPPIDARPGFGPLPPNQDSVLKFESDEPMSKEMADGLNARPPTQTLYVHGRIRYVDRFGQTHNMRFCRSFVQAINTVAASCAIPDEED